MTTSLAEACILLLLALSVIWPPAWRRPASYYCYRCLSYDYQSGRGLHPIIVNTVCHMTTSLAEACIILLLALSVIWPPAWRRPASYYCYRCLSYDYQSGRGLHPIIVNTVCHMTTSLAEVCILLLLTLSVIWPPAWRRSASYYCYRCLSYDHQSGRGLHPIIVNTVCHMTTSLAEVCILLLLTLSVIWPPAWRRPASYYC